MCMYSHIVTVYNGVANCLTQHILRYFQLLYTCYPFVVNRGQKVLGTQQFNDTIQIFLTFKYHVRVHF